MVIDYRCIPENRFPGKDFSSLKTKIRAQKIQSRTSAGIVDTALLQFRFAMTSSVATLVDYVLYLAMVAYLFPPVPSNIVSYSIGILVNFYLQKRFIFRLNRKEMHTFALSLSFSLVGLVISTLLIYILTQFFFFLSHQYITKFTVTGLIFFYNFYTKRFAFEQR